MTGLMIWLAVFIAVCGIGMVLALAGSEENTPKTVAGAGALAGRLEAIAQIGLRHPGVLRARHGGRTKPP